MSIHGSIAGGIGIQGPQGIQGATGATGPAGPTGEPTVGSYSGTTSDNAPVLAITYAIGTRKGGILELYGSAYCTVDNTASTFAYRYHLRRGGSGAPVEIIAAVDLGTQTEAGCSISVAYTAGGNMEVSLIGDPAKGITWGLSLYKKVGF